MVSHFLQLLPDKIMGLNNFETTKGYHLLYLGSNKPGIREQAEQIVHILDELGGKRSETSTWTDF